MPGPRPARPVRSVWELTAYTNGRVILTGCFSGELHRPIRWLGVSYGLISLAELPPPIQAYVQDPTNEATNEKSRAAAQELASWLMARLALFSATQD